MRRNVQFPQRCPFREQMFWEAEGPVAWARGAVWLLGFEADVPACFVVVDFTLLRFECEPPKWGLPSTVPIKYSRSAFNLNGTLSSTRELRKVLDSPVVSWKGFFK